MSWLVKNHAFKLQISILQELSSISKKISTDKLSRSLMINYSLNRGIYQQNTTHQFKILQIVLYQQILHSSKSVSGGVQLTRLLPCAHDTCKVFLCIIWGAVQAMAITKPGMAEEGTVSTMCLSTHWLCIYIHTYKILG